MEDFEAGGEVSEHGYLGGAKAVRLLATVAFAVTATVTGVASASAQSAAAGAGTLKQVATIEGPAELVRAAGTQAYVASGKMLTIYDIATPSAPKRRGAFEFPEKIWGFRVYGSLLYVADGFSGMQILDVSNPDAPVVRGIAKTAGQSKAVSVAGNKAVVANHMTGVDLIDVADTKQPRYIGSAFLDGYARDAAIAGTTAYAVDNPTGLYVLDVANVATKNFDPASALQDAHAPQVIELAETTAGARLAVLVGGEPIDPKRTPRPAGTRPRGTLQFWDLSTAAKPVMASLYRTPGIPRHVAMQGALAYVADSEDGLHVVDISSPAKPVAVVSQHTTAPARYVAVSGSTVLVVIGGPPAAAGQPPSSVAVLTYER